MIAPMTRCARRVDQRGDMSSFSRHAYVCIESPILRKDADGTTEQVETLLKNQESNESNRNSPRQDPTLAYVASTIQGSHVRPAETATSGSSTGQDAFQAHAAANAQSGQGSFPWEMIDLGLDEPLPPQDVINDL
jgi:hypothetical protein